MFHRKTKLYIDSLYFFTYEAIIKSTESLLKNYYITYSSASILCIEFILYREWFILINATHGKLAIIIILYRWKTNIGFKDSTLQNYLSSQYYLKITFSVHLYNMQ